MTQAKHTPGPWRIGCTKGSHRLICHDDLQTPGAASEIIALVTVRLTWKAEQEANATLIAAAPDLLEAAKEYLAAAKYSMTAEDDVSAMLRFGDADKALRAAIVKATGGAA